MSGVQILGPVSAEHATILTPDAVQFLATLHRCFNGRRLALLAARDARQRRLDQGELPDFLPHTAAVRADPSWRGAPPAPGLVDRRVEITGPVDRKMVINALNCGASTFMADFEDSNAPTWRNSLDGQFNLRDALRRTITYAAPGPGGKTYSLGPEGTLATLIVRPRGWHMEEAHLLVDGAPASASLFDFGLYLFHGARQSLAVGQGPYFYLPKMESHLEARLWNDVFCVSQDLLKIPRGTVRATVLIETILAAFEMEEILFELREHSAGLNCGRWDYIFSFIKKFRNRPDMVLPDRSAITMTTPFMSAYVRLLIQTCHRRGVHAMGGMAAQIPIRHDAAANAAALTKVRADKEREARAGHDGTWVAHPALVPLAKEVFDSVMPQPNQLFVRREDVVVSRADLLSKEGLGGAPTEEGVRNNLNVALQYMESWLRGVGCVPIHNLMEDAATAEISRSQLWQWVRHGARAQPSGRVLDAAWVSQLLQEETDALRRQRAQAAAAAAAASGRGGGGGGADKLDAAQALLVGTIQGGPYSDFLTTLCYESICEPQARAALAARGGGGGGGGGGPRAPAPSAAMARL